MDEHSKLLRDQAEYREAWEELKRIYKMVTRMTPGDFWVGKTTVVVSQLLKCHEGRKKESTTQRELISVQRHLLNDYRKCWQRVEKDWPLVAQDVLRGGGGGTVGHLVVDELVSFLPSSEDLAETFSSNLGDNPAHSSPAPDPQAGACLKNPPDSPAPPASESHHLQRPSEPVSNEMDRAIGSSLGKPHAGGMPHTDFPDYMVRFVWDCSRCGAGNRDMNQGRKSRFCAQCGRDRGDGGEAQ